MCILTVPGQSRALQSCIVGSLGAAGAGPIVRSRPWNLKKSVNLIKKEYFVDIIWVALGKHDDTSPVLLLSGNNIKYLRNYAVSHFPFKLTKRFHSKERNNSL